MDLLSGRMGELDEREQGDSGGARDGRGQLKPDRGDAAREEKVKAAGCAGTWKGESAEGLSVTRVAHSETGEQMHRVLDPGRPSVTQPGL